MNSQTHNDLYSKYNAISEHVEKYIGNISHAITKAVSEDDAIILLIVRPTPSQNYFTLITCGLSEKPMNAVDPNDPNRLCELMICLPGDWPLPMTEEEIWASDDKTLMPIFLLFNIAQYALSSRSVWIGNTITGVKEKDYPNIKSFLLEMPIEFPPEFAFLAGEQTDECIFFIGIYPIYEAEYEYKLKQGAEALFDKMIDSQVSLIFNPTRKCAIKQSLMSRVLSALLRLKS